MRSYEIGYRVMKDDIGVYADCTSKREYEWKDAGYRPITLRKGGLLRGTMQKGKGRLLSITAYDAAGDVIRRNIKKGG